MKLPFLIVTFFLYVSVNGQSIEGKYCWSFKNKFMGQITRCLDFDGNGRFISELITDVGIIEEGDYEVLGDKLIMIYDLEDNTEYVKKDYEMFNIKKNEGWSFEKYYEISTGVKFGERLKREFIILKNKTEKLKLKNLATKKRITLYKNFT